MSSNASSNAPGWTHTLAHPLRRRGAAQAEDSHCPGLLGGLQGPPFNPRVRRVRQGSEPKASLRWLPNGTGMACSKDGSRYLVSLLAFEAEQRSPPVQLPEVAEISTDLLGMYSRFHRLATGDDKNLIAIPVLRRDAPGLTKGRDHNIVGATDTRIYNYVERPVITVETLWGSNIRSSR
jgi:hypothetical protein